MTKVWVRIGLGVACVMALAACSSAAQTSADVDAAASFDELFEAYAEYPFSEVRERGLSDGVIEILERSRANGAVSLSDLDEAVNHTTACFDDYGIGWEFTYGVDIWGMPARDFVYWAPAGVDKDDVEHPWLNLADECQFANSLTVQTLYDNQPRSAEQTSVYMATQGAAVVECLESAGTAVGEPGDPEAVIAAAKEHLDATGDPTCLQLAFEPG